MTLSREPLVIAIAIAAGLACAVPLPSAALAVAPAQAAQEEPQSEGQRSIGTYFAQLEAGEYAKALVTAEKIHLSRENNLGRALTAAMRGGAMIGLKRDDEAVKLFAEARALAPDEPFVNSLEFLAALISKRIEFAATALDAMIARAPDEVREIDPELMWHFLREEPKEQVRRNEDRRVALARLGYGGNEGDQLGYEAIGILIKRGDATGAAELVQHVDEPQLVEDMLIHKRYAALWSVIEASAGPALSKVRASTVAAAEQAYRESPEDPGKLHVLANALRHGRRLNEAIALRPKLPASPAAIAAADQETGWAINNVALAMHESGRADEADRLFASLNEARMENGQWRVSMKINRLELLVADGKFQQALPLIEATESSARTEGNAYAQQLVRRLKYCTTSGLGRKDEAGKLLLELLKHSEDAPGPTIDGLLCGGEIEKAEQVALAALKKDKFESDFLRSLQARPLTSDDPSIWSKGWTMLRHRPAILREFNRLGRDIPEPFLPPAKSL